MGRSHDAQVKSIASGWSVKCSCGWKREGFARAPAARMAWRNDHPIPTDQQRGSITTK